MFKNPFTARNIPFIAILLAIEIVLQVLGNYIAFGPVSINLSLVTIALGAILYGPWCGLFLGLINSLFVFLSPYTMPFYEASTIGTIVTVIVKSSTAGFVSGIIYHLLKNKNNLVATIIASISIPIINTGLFVVGSLIFFRGYVESVTPEGQNLVTFLFIGMTGWNFIFEISVSALLVYPIYRIITYISSERQLQS